MQPAPQPWEALSLAVVGIQSPVPQRAARGTSVRAGTGLRTRGRKWRVPGLTPPPEPAPRPRPSPSSATLSLSISANRLQTRRPGSGLIQSARYLGRRLHYQPGPRQARPDPAGRPRLLRSRRCARAPRGGTWPRPAPHSLGPRKPGGPRAGGQGARHRDPVAAGHVSAPRSRDPLDGPRRPRLGRAELERQRLGRRRRAGPGRLLGLWEVARAELGVGWGEEGSS